MKEKKDSLSSGRSSVGQSFYATLKSVMESYDIDSFGAPGSFNRTAAEGLCKIITETVILGDFGNVSIGGEHIPRSVVKAVYAGLTDEHLQYVIDKMKTIDYGITNRKAYLTAALYNSYFELDTEC